MPISSSTAEQTAARGGEGAARLAPRDGRLRPREVRTDRTLAGRPGNRYICRHRLKPKVAQVDLCQTGDTHTARERGQPVRTSTCATTTSGNLCHLRIKLNCRGAEPKRSTDSLACIARTGTAGWTAAHAGEGYLQTLGRRTPRNVSRTHYQRHVVPRILTRSGGPRRGPSAP